MASDEEIDELALKIEQKIAEGEEFLNELPRFEEGRVMREQKTVVNVDEILSG